MSVVVVGISHRTAPVAMLEALALDRDGVHRLLADARGCDHVHEAAVVATCNRLEVYVDADEVPGVAEDLSALLVRGAGDSGEQVSAHLYVRHDTDAVSHLFHVVAGLDSMVLGEGQILGQTRTALRAGQEMGVVGPVLNSLFQQALRVGKRTHAETDIDHAAPSLVTAALDRAIGRTDLAGLRVVVVGAGSMAGLAVTTATGRGGDVVVLNRTHAHALRLADQHGARAAELRALPEEIASADVVLACAGAHEVLITRDMVLAARRDPARPLAVIDLAMPHDVDPEVASLPGVTLTDLTTMAHELRGAEGSDDVDEVRVIVRDEIDAYLTEQQRGTVKPTVVALRALAAEVVDTELARLDSRIDLAPGARAEVRNAVERVVEKLLYRPTTRVREFSGSTAAVSHETALVDLFALDSASEALR